MSVCLCVGVSVSQRFSLSQTDTNCITNFYLCMEDPSFKEKKLYTKTTFALNFVLAIAIGRRQSPSKLFDWGSVIGPTLALENSNNFICNPRFWTYYTILNTLTMKLFTFCGSSWPRPACQEEPEELESWNFERMFIPPYVSYAMCHVSRVMCHNRMFL